MPTLSSLSQSSKKRKIVEDSAQVSIRELETKLTDAITSKASLNPLADLLDLTTAASDPQVVHKGIYALYRIFVTLITQGKLDPQSDEEAKVVREWISERLNVYSAFLFGLLKDEEPTLRTSSLQILFSLLKHLSSTLSKTPSQPQFHVPFFKKVIYALLLCPPSSRSKGKGHRASNSTEGVLDAQVKDLFIGTWLNVYADVRWFFLRDSQPILSTYPPRKYPHVRENMLSVLESLASFPTKPSDLKAWYITELGVKPPSSKIASKTDKSTSDPDSDSDEQSSAAAEDDWRTYFDEPDTSKASTKITGPSTRLNKLTIHQSLHSLSSHRAVFTRLWLTMLPQLSSDGEDISSALSMRALNVMHRGVMPHLTKAIMVMDWVGACVDYGGVVGLLALNTLFILMQEYNLDYPSFYTRLYSFLDKDVLHLKHRARFFRLADLFLSSTHLPATLLASFIKRLSRLSLHGSPSSIVIIIPFAYNILKRHPALMVMIHRDAEDISLTTEDPFLADEPNPNLTNALDSSLWELYSHKHHYHSGVSTLARIFEEAFTKPNFPLEDFLDHTYNTLFEAETKRRVKKEPAVATDLRKNAFPSSSDDSEVASDRDAIGSSWMFS
ncbi:hypothetical protein EW146_g5773 [Bondarzewia mesenterica]|uniref:CCAAT-binding factor domain-containing protein n=1 Tax=Bondarzewia mesenterica TaxID=1095465 RepID=A0A4S4LSI7_9AGAM|nr:hypothetical protein EW146_g5773 [Bondarzewia mesenterica]